MDTWEALEELMDEERWPEAAAGVRELLDAWRGMKGAPKQVEKVACGSFRPRSVPATLAV